MLTFKELYERIVLTGKRQTGEDYFEEFDPKQLNCLFRPKKQTPVDKDAALKAAEMVSRDVAAMLNELATDPLHVYALVAPAFLGQFGAGVTPGMLRSAFKKMGFDGMLEVSVFADILTLKEALEFDQNINTETDYQLTSCCCPMWLAMIRKVYGELMPHVPATVSPMIAAGRTVKILHPQAMTVFIGPCVAKKAEAKEPDLRGAIDHVLTFQETSELFQAMKINPKIMPENEKEFSSRAGRIYAHTGGVSEAVRATLVRLHPTRKIPIRAKQADGVSGCKAMMEELVAGKIEANFYEGMGCVGGCVGGPRAIIDKSDAAAKVDEYGEEALYPTPIDNPYVIELLMRLGFDTTDSLIEDNKFFTRKF